MFPPSCTTGRQLLKPLDVHPHPPDALPQHRGEAARVPSGACMRRRDGVAGGCGEGPSSRSRVRALPQPHPWRAQRHHRASLLAWTAVRTQVPWPHHPAPPLQTKAHHGVSPCCAPARALPAPFRLLMLDREALQLLLQPGGITVILAML